MNTGRRGNKRNKSFRNRSRYNETVYFPAPDSKGGISSFEMKDIACENNNKRAKKDSSSLLSRVFGDLISNDDLIVILLILLILFTRKKDDTEECQTEEKEKNSDFLSTDILSGITGFLDKLQDNDLLLIALLYILM